MQRQYRRRRRLPNLKKWQDTNKNRLRNKSNKPESSIGACYEFWRNNDEINYDNFSILVSRLRISKSSTTN